MKKRTRVLFVFAVALMALVIATPVSAEDKVSEEINLGGETLEGVLDGPGGDFFRQRDIFIQHSLITFRDDFIPEMVITLEDF
ncbi:hypothetical protein KKF84_20245 [Myxococcota bacterium]|nr:hypothetical protein [Myxococcota bacterium]